MHIKSLLMLLLIAACLGGFANLPAAAQDGAADGKDPESGAGSGKADLGSVPRVEVGPHLPTMNLDNPVGMGAEGVPEMTEEQRRAAQELYDKMMAESELVESGPEPMMHFAGIFDKDQKVVGTISMIEGNQKVRALKGVILEATGKLSYQAATEKGLYVDFIFDVGSTDGHSGFVVSRLDIELNQQENSVGPPIYVHHVEPIGEEFQYAYQPVFAEEVLGFKSTFADLKVCDGLMYFKVADLAGKADRLYRGQLFGPLQGELTEVGPDEIPDCLSKS